MKSTASRINQLSKTMIFSMIFSCFLASAQAQLSPQAEQNIAAIRTNTANTPNYLRQIQEYTRQILEKLNSIPPNISNFIQSWLAQDNSDFTKNTQSDFTTLGNQLYQAQSMQYDTSFMQRLNQTLLPKPDKNAIPYANDLVYSSLFGTHIFEKEPRQNNPDVAYNYLGNLSGIFIPHKIPNLNWVKQDPKDNSIEKYISFYSTILAAESFDASALARLYPTQNNPQEITKLKTRANLILKASDANWFAKIATQELGVILRQILLFQAQTYVLLNDMLDTQKQMLTAQIIQNSLIIQNGATVEDTLYLSASGKIPKV